MPKKTSKPHYKGKHLKFDHHSIFLFKMRSQFHLALSESIDSTKVKGALQPTFTSLGQFLVTKINFSKFLNCKQHLFKLVSIPTGENMFSVSISKPTILNICLTKKPTIGSTYFCFFHHPNRHLMFFASICIYTYYLSTYSFTYLFNFNH